MINLWNPDLAVVPRPTKAPWKTYRHLADHVFIHIPKSGGTTFKNMFPMIDRGRTRRKPHFYRDPKKHYKYVAVMRDPFQRIWSHWHWNLHHQYLQPLNQYHPSVNPHTPYETTYFHFPGLEGSLSNLAARMMTGIIRPTVEQALEAYDKFFYVLDFENFQQSSNVLCSMCRIKPKELIHENKSVPRDPIPKSFVEFVERISPVDLALYEHHRAKCTK